MPPIQDPATAAADLADAIGLAALPGGELMLGRLRLRPVAVGWATVDLDRATAELRALGPFLPTSPDLLLGATARTGPGGPAAGAPGRPSVVLLEPSTEGRLAAILARRGEGWAALYVAPVALPGPAPGDPGPILARLAETGLALRRGQGPLGPAVLVGDPGGRSPGRGAGPGSGPALVLVVDPRTAGRSPAGRGSTGDGVPSGP